MNKKSVALNEKQYYNLLSYLRERYNPQIADALMLEAVTGMRIGDILSLKKSEVVADGRRFRLEKVEQKTGKRRTFTISRELFYFISELNGKEQSCFTISVRRVQQALSEASQHFGYSCIGTHSFRKFFATEIYNSSGNIALVSELLQHSSIAITQRYISVTSEQVEQALTTQGRFFFRL